MKSTLPTADELHRQYFASRLWAAGVTLDQAMRTPLIRLGLICAAMARRTPGAPRQATLFQEESRC